MVIEMNYSDWATWSDHVGDPEVIRPRPQEWDMVEFLINNGFWIEIQGVQGEEPRLLGGMNIVPPTEFELSYYTGAGEVALADCTVVSNEAYDSVSPLESQFENSNEVVVYPSDWGKAA
jgi:hypothetical protein